MTVELADRDCRPRGLNGGRDRRGNSVALRLGTLGAAAELYGVVIDEDTLEIDIAATERLRTARRGEAVTGSLKGTRSA